MQTHVATSDATIVGTATADVAARVPTRVSWGAVFAGAVVAVAVGAMLNVLGAAIGVSTVDPATPGATPSGTSLAMAGGIWFIVANLIGLAVGGYVAARLSGTADDTDGVLHGLSVWALGFILSGMLLGNLAAGAVNTAVTGASSIIGGVAQGAGNVAAAAAPAAANAAQGANPNALVDRLQAALQSGGNVAQMTSDQRKAEIGRIVTARVTSGNFEGNSRDRLSQLVAAEFNIPAAEANQRIATIEQDAQRTAAEAERRAREAAETASNAAATGAYWFFAAMLLGAIAAVLGARIGTRRRVVVSRAYA